ncbi:MAG: AMP nucleosidase [Hyphomicrobiales bacterium]|nr:AMP nucleosidase [Hyphomicrobiales bacterium]MBV8662830.1 AMP nucleosidase [Hyphomicrobiales bacterium]
MKEGRLTGNFQRVATAREAVDRLAALYAQATGSLRAAVERFLSDGTTPTEAVRATFRYPELRVTYQPDGVPPSSARAFAKFTEAGVYSATVTQPEDFRPYLLEQLEPLVEEFGAEIEVGVGEQEIPYPYVFESGDELGRGGATASELARFFPVPSLAEVGDEIVDGAYEIRPGYERPLALFDAARTDYSLRRLVHYTGSDWRAMQPWVLLTNYHRYVDQFVRWGLEQLRKGAVKKLVLPGNIVLDSSLSPEQAEAKAAAVVWHRFQMPAYHVVRADGRGVSLVNIGVGPANAKNITDHIAVLRPHCWLMVGHCAGLRQSQVIGDYVLAHGYVRQDHILDDAVPLDMPIPALAEVQVALQEAVAGVTGDRGEALKRRLRTGTVVTNDDRNWELRWTQERRRINLSRAIAVDMESATIATQGFRMRVPYGTLLCVSDKPLHGEIKLPGAANAFYERAIGEHLQIGIAALEMLQTQRASLHSRKLRSFDEPPFR